MGKLKLLLFVLASLVLASNSAPVSDESRIYFPDEIFGPSSNQNAIIGSNLDVAPTVPVQAPNVSETDAEVFLNEHGFSKSVSVRFGDVNEYSLNDKLRAYQKYSGLAQTGKLDDATKVTLGKARCGVSDVASLGITKWSKSRLTYNIQNYPSSRSFDEIRKLIRKAFDSWSAVTQLNFEEVPNPHSDIDIVFGSNIHQNRAGMCQFPFNDQTLAHATYPELGTVHFNTRYYFDTYGADEFLTTAMHEIGHALGLEHSPSKASLMYPTMTSIFSEIPALDAEKIQIMYGTRQKEREASGLQLCSVPKVDAILYDKSKTLYVIAGKYFYQIKGGLASTGQLLSTKWPGIPDNIDAAFTGYWTFFFRGTKVWAFDRDELLPEYPRTIGSAFPGIPDDVDAVYQDGSGSIFALKGHFYYRYDIIKKGVESWGKISDFGGPNDVEAAVFDSKQNTVYLLKDTFFYRYTYSQGAIKEKSEWFIC